MPGRLGRLRPLQLLGFRLLLLGDLGHGGGQPKISGSLQRSVQLPDAGLPLGQCATCGWGSCRAEESIP